MQITQTASMEIIAPGKFKLRIEYLIMNIALGEADVKAVIQSQASGLRPCQDSPQSNPTNSEMIMELAHPNAWT
jgi:hypothetical protein